MGPSQSDSIKQRPSFFDKPKSINIIRYYPSFRKAIPIFRVGYPSITHPFAARNFSLSCPNKKPSLDLHV